MGYSWDFRFLAPYTIAFLRGALVTVELSLVSFGLGTAVGIFGGVWLKLTPVRSFFLYLNDAIRAVPVLVLIFLVYYFPTRQMFGVIGPNPFWSVVIAMAVGQAAYTADLVRGAVDGVSRKTILGGRALGLSEITIWRYLILPDVVRQILPAQIAFFIGIVRLSSLASVIGCEDVVFVARVASSPSFRSLEAWVVVSLIYIALVLPMTVISRRVEQWDWMKRRA